MACRAVFCTVPVAVLYYLSSHNYFPIIAVCLVMPCCAMACRAVHDAGYVVLCRVMPCCVVPQTLRILLQAEGPNAAWFRPREAVVRRVLRKEEDGVYVVLFSSTENALTRMRHEGEGCWHLL